MRYPDTHKGEVRSRIVKAAAAALRLGGLDGVSIPALMKQAGLTHGGFYAHFKNRDELVASAVHSAAAETADAVFGEGLTRDETLNRYLSPGHAAHPERGCVLAALGADGARQPASVKRAFAEVALGFLQLTDSKLHPGEGRRTPSDEALVQASTMIGAVVLSRLVRSPKLAARILAAARHAG